MDRLKEYLQIVERIVGGHLEAPPKEEQIETLSVCDRVGGHYLLLEIGWQPPRRVYSVVFHIRLKGGKIWIEQDWTEHGVARELLEAGVPPEAIELGFQPLEMRPHAHLKMATSH